MTQPLHGRNAIITGANQGLGLAIALAYVDAGAGVMLCARDEALLAAARTKVAARAGQGQRVEARRADVSSESDVAALVGAALTSFGRVHILVNNAGVYGPMGPIDEVDWAQWRRAMDINVSGSILPLRALLPHFRQNRYGKVVQLSGGGATNPLARITAYAASKAAIVRLMESVAVDVAGLGIDINSIAPGALNTRMMEEVIAAGPDTVGADFHARMTSIAAQGGTPLDVGAALAVYLGSAASDGITGRLISAVWDPWESLHDRRADLEGSDIYTLRRIVPKDRGKPWGDR